MVGRSVQKLLTSVTTCLVGLQICISSAITKKCLQKISELDYICEQLRPNYTGRPEQIFGRGIYIGDGESGVSLYSFSLMKVDIYKKSLSSRRTWLVELMEVHYESENWTAKIEKEATRGKVLNEGCNNDVF